MTRLSIAGEVPLVFEQVRQRLLAQIGRRWRPGQQLPPTPELARQLRAGQRSTLRAVQSLVRDGLLASRPGKGTFVCDRAGRSPVRDADSAAPTRPHVRRRVRIVANLAGRDPFIMDMVNAASDVLGGDADAEPVQSATCSSDYTNLTDGDLDGLLIVQPPVDTLRYDHRAALVVLSTASDVTVDADAGYDMVLVDERHGGMLAGRRLREAGCTRPCFIGAADVTGAHLMDGVSQRRLAGMTAGFGAAVPPERRLIAKRYGQTSAARLLPRFLRLDPMPDGVFAASDELAVGFIVGALACGLDVPGDVRVVGFDGQQLGRSLADGPLTTVQVPSRAMGELAAEMLIDRLNDPGRDVRRVQLGCSLFSGATA